MLERRTNRCFLGSSPGICVHLMTTGEKHCAVTRESLKCFSVTLSHTRLSARVSRAALGALLLSCGTANQNGTQQPGTTIATTAPNVAPTTAAPVSPSAPVTPTSPGPTSPSAGTPPSPATTAVNPEQPATPPVTPSTSPTPEASAGNASDDSSNTTEDTTTPLGALELTDLRIDANPNSVLSAFVSWKTSTPASSAVHFGVGEYTWEIADETSTTEHRVLVIGMRAQQAYQLKALSSNDAGAGEATGEFTTLALPDVIPTAEVSDYDPALAQPGWTLINVQKGQGDYRARSDEPPMAVMYDEEGQPVWYVISGSSPDVGGAVSVDLTDVGVLVGPQMQGAASPREYDFAGDLKWQCSNATCGSGGDLSHHAGKLPNGNYVVNRDVNVSGVTMPIFQEFAPPENDAVWQLDLRAVLPPPGSASGDWCHGNSVTVKADKNEVYASCRFLGVIKTTYDNPTLIWHLPASYGAQGMGDFTFDPPESQFSDIHDPEIHDDGTVMVFDNGGWAGAVGQYNPTGLESRVVEYLLDEEAGVAKRVWEFPGDFEVDAWYRDSWYQPFWGDADRLANRNVLMTAGMRGPDLRSRVFEATNDGKVVWVMQLPPDYGLYRAERITPPLVRKLP
jgi:hypothetical protein